MDTTRIGVIGTGYWGPNLIRNFIELPGSQVVAVADLDQAQLDNIKQRFPQVKVTTREYCDLYRLDKENFDRVIQRYPDFAERIHELAEKRQAENEAIQKSKESGSKEKEIPEHIEEIQAEYTGEAVSLRWNWVRDLRYYEVMRKNPHTGKWIYLEKKLLEPNITDPHPEPDRPTVYRIRAIKTSGSGDWSDPVEIEPPPPVEEEPQE